MPQNAIYSNNTNINCATLKLFIMLSFLKIFQGLLPQVIGPILNTTKAH